MSSSHNTTSSTQSEYARLRLQLTGMKDQVSEIAVSPDSLSIAAVSIRGEVRMWGILDQSGILLRQPNDVEAVIRRPRGVAFSPDGRFLAAGVGNAAYLWVAKTGQPKFQFADHQDLVKSLVFSPDSKYLACGAKDIRIWNVDTKQQVHVLKGHTNHVSGLSYFSGGKRLLSSSWDTTIRIWNVDQGGKLQDTWKAHGNSPINCCALSPDGHMLASGGSDRQVILRNVESGDWLTKPHQGHSWCVWSVSFSPDGKHVASASRDGIHIQDSNTGSCIAKVDGSDRLVAYTPDGKHIVTRNKDHTKVVQVLELTPPAVPLHAPQASGLSGRTQPASSTSSAADALGYDDSLPPPYE